MYLFSHFDIQYWTEINTKKLKYSFQYIPSDIYIWWNLSKLTKTHHWQQTVDFLEPKNLENNKLSCRKIDIQMFAYNMKTF